MLEEHDVVYDYREYTRKPLDIEEIREALKALGVGPREVLRRNDKAFRELGLTGEEGDQELVRLMSEYPTLLQRPIAILQGRAVLGRPPERILDLIS